MWRAFFLSCLLSMAAVPSWAHPHVFVDVSLQFQRDDQGRVQSVQVTWAYDPFFSLLVLSDRGLDADADLVLTDAERAALLGFDLMDWPEGFDGALFADSDGEALRFGAAEALSADLVDGALVTRHRRDVEPIALGPGDSLTVRPFDPYYYAALSLVAAEGWPEGCEGRIFAPDTAAADAELAGMAGSADEGFFEEARVGHLYAYTLAITCAGS